jgi:hypothetical protein
MTAIKPETTAEGRYVFQHTYKAEYSDNVETETVILTPNPESPLAAFIIRHHKNAKSGLSYDDIDLLAREHTGDMDELEAALKRLRIESSNLSDGVLSRVSEKAGEFINTRIEKGLVNAEEVASDSQALDYNFIPIDIGSDAPSYGERIRTKLNKLAGSGVVTTDAMLDKKLLSLVADLALGQPRLAALKELDRSLGTYHQRQLDEIAYA